MIINITGQICSGKSTLAKKLNQHLKFPVLEIDAYRRKTEDEWDAWIQMYEDSLKHKNYIVDTSGLNGRVTHLLKKDVITIKLTCNKKTALERLNKKEKLNIKLPYKEFKTHEDFIDFWEKNQHRIKEDFKVNTDKLTPQGVFEKVNKFLMIRMKKIKDPLEEVLENPLDFGVETNAKKIDEVIYK